MSKYLGLDRIVKFFDIIRQNGGFKASYFKMYRYEKTLLYLWLCII